MNTTEIREHPPIGTFTVHTDFGVYLLSSEFSHDTALRVTGDFRDDAELVSFAGTIAMRLNRYEELLDEVERLRAALKPMTEGTHWITDEEVENARKALEQKL